MITVGFDLGTHQTKLCYEDDEDPERLKYTFFTFIDPKGKEQIILPSLVQVNEDNTLSYGFVDQAKRKKVYRYFKQAYFNGGWEEDIDAQLLCIWYVTYILFDLDEKIEEEFYNIQFGIPSGSRLLKRCTDKAMSLLLSAFNLKNQFEYKSEFLSMTVEDLIELTEIKNNYEGAKEECDIHLFPEAYASLLPMIAQRLMERELSILVDIGGGTTDMTLFSYTEGKNPKTKRFEKKLQVSWYQSINKGLNYVAELIAEQSDCEIASIATNLYTADQQISQEAFTDLYDNVGREILYLQSMMRRGFEKVRPHEGHLLRNMLHDRPVIYTGGGSTYRELTRSLHAFSDVHKLDNEHWRRLHITNLHMTKGIEPILSVCLGLAIYQDDDNIHLLPFEELFKGHSWNDAETVLPNYTEDYGLLDTK